MRLSMTPEADESGGLTANESEAPAGEGVARGLREVPEWIQQQLPALLKVLEAARLLVHVSSSKGSGIGDCEYELVMPGLV